MRALLHDMLLGMARHDLTDVCRLFALERLLFFFQPRSFIIRPTRRARRMQVWEYVSSCRCIAVCPAWGRVERRTGTHGGGP